MYLHSCSLGVAVQPPDSRAQYFLSVLAIVFGGKSCTRQTAEAEAEAEAEAAAAATELDIND